MFHWGSWNGSINCNAFTRSMRIGTSRKWLTGPRGVGLLCVRPALAAELTPVLPLPPDVPPLRAFESGEAHVAGRVGLVLAVGEHLAAGPDRVRARLAALGRATRELLDG